MLRALATFTFRLLLGGALAGVDLAGYAFAQIRTDGSFGGAGRPLAGPNFMIGADLGKQVGHNLFHSFTTFNVGLNQTAEFQGPASVANIISRVTGGQSSTVNGTVTSSIPKANLFLINPAGWIFGPQGAVSAKGSVHISSADTLRFADGTVLPARVVEGSSLTAASPTAFGFLSANPGKIQIQGTSLTTGTANDLSIVGGPIDIGAPSVSTGTGKIRIVSAAGAGEVGLQHGSKAGTAPKAYGRVDISGTNITLNDATAGQKHGGLRIKGGAVTISDSSFEVHNRSDANFATVVVRGDDIAMNRSQIQGFANGTGNGGAIHVKASRNVTIGGFGPHRQLSLIGSSSVSLAAGQSGSVDIGSGGSIILQPGAAVGNASFTSRAPALISLHAPDIQINGPNSAVLSSASTEAAVGQSAFSQSLAAAGQIVLTGNTITMTNGGGIAAFPLGPGSSGSITVTAHTLTLDNSPLITSTIGPGDAGQINVAADRLVMLDGGQIQSGSVDLGLSESLGHGGNIVVNGNTQPLNLTISGPGSGIFAASTGANSKGAGSISINAGTIAVTDRGTISTSARSGGGGLVDITASQLMQLDRGSITTSVSGGTANAGDISAVGRFIVLNHGSVIQASADAGRGGNISITTQAFISSPGSLVDASAARGINGTILIQGQQTDVTATLAELSGKLLDEPNLRRQGCGVAARSEGTSSLVAGGTGGLPRDGDGPQAALYFDGQGSASSVGSELPVRIEAEDSVGSEKRMCWR